MSSLSESEGLTISRPEVADDGGRMASVLEAGQITTVSTTKRSAGHEMAETSGWVGTTYEILHDGTLPAFAELCRPGR